MYLAKRFDPLDLYSLTPQTLLLIAAAFALVFIVIGVKIAGWFASLQSQERNQTAQDGEAEAEQILKKAGYNIVARQHCAKWSMMIDGNEIEVNVRVDLIVERKGRRFVAEVKTGNRAPDPSLPATRRQLLEYCLVFNTDCVLLVDVPAGKIRRVGFPSVQFG